MTSDAGAGSSAVRLDDVRMRFGDVEALAGLTLDIARGKATVLLGPNGAGKTTAIRLRQGLGKPTSGSVQVFGADPQAPAARRRVGVMMQVAKVPENLKVIEHIDTFRAYYPNPLPRAELVELAGLAGLAGYERRFFGRLSGGEQQRVLFALAMAGNPDLLFLDEPTVGMDVDTRRAFWKQVRRLKDEGRTILLTTHYLEEADALADRIVVLDHGRIIADGSPSEIKKKVSGHRITCRTRLALAEIRALAGVTLALHDDDLTLIDTDHLEAVLRAMLTRDETLSDLAIKGAALEDAFVAITNAGKSEESH